MKSWDQYFLNICNAVASNSKCLSRQIGAILVRDKVIVATGYNGPPRGFHECPERWKDLYDPLANEIASVKDIPPGEHCPRRALGYKSGERPDLCPAVHAEVNCIASAARVGVNVNHTIMYMNDQVPCKNCLGALIDAGVDVLVVTSVEPYDQMALAMLKQSNLTVRTFEGEFLSHKGTVIPSREQLMHERDVE